MALGSDYEELERASTGLIENPSVATPGHWEASHGGISNFGGAHFCGSTGGQHLNVRVGQIASSG